MAEVVAGIGRAAAIAGLVDVSTRLFSTPSHIDTDFDQIV